MMLHSDHDQVEEENDNEVAETMQVDERSDDVATEEKKRGRTPPPPLYVKFPPDRGCNCVHPGTFVFCSCATEGDDSHGSWSNIERYQKAFRGKYSGS